MAYDDMMPFTSCIVKARTVKRTRVATTGPMEDQWEERSLRFTVGIRVQLKGGEYWFCSIKHKSWTNHQPGLPLTYKTGLPTGEVGPDRKRGPYTGDRDLTKRLGHCKKPYDLVGTLLFLRDKAMEDL